MQLPDYRRIQSGRTWPSVYRPETFTAIDRGPRRHVWADVTAAVVLGVAGAALLFWGLSS